MQMWLGRSEAAKYANLLPQNYRALLVGRLWPNGAARRRSTSWRTPVSCSQSSRSARNQLERSVGELIYLAGRSRWRISSVI